MLTIISCTERLNLEVVAGIFFAKICYSLVILEASVITTFLFDIPQENKEIHQNSSHLGKAGALLPGCMAQGAKSCFPQNCTGFACLGNAFIAAGFITAQTEGAEQ